MFTAIAVATVIIKSTLLSFNGEFPKTKQRKNLFLLQLVILLFCTRLIIQQTFVDCD